MENKRYYITLGVITVLVIFVTLMIVSVQSVNVSGNLGCSINNIELVNVSPYQCWYDDFANEMCPIPKDIQCNGAWNIPFNIKLIKEAIEAYSD